MDRENRAYTVLAGVLLAALVVVVALLLWRTRNPGDDRRAADSGTAGVIAEEPGAMPVEDGVAVWVKPGEDIERLLTRNGLANATHADLGEGTYVVSIGEQDPETVIERLEQDEGVVDAGHVYAEGGE